MKKWGLALGAGGMLGLAHIGVLQVFAERGMGPSFVTGTSAGSVIAGLYAAGVDFGSLEDIAVQVLSPNEEPAEVPNLLERQDIYSTAFSGLTGGGLIEAALDMVARGCRLRDVKTPVSLMSVDIITGAIVVFTSNPPMTPTSVRALGLAGRVYVDDAKVSEAIRASSSVPGVFKPKKFGSWSLVDGGVRDMVPVFEARRMGAEEVVAVDLGLHVYKPQDAEGMLAILSRSFQLATRESTERNIQEYASITLQPDVMETGLPTPAKARRLIEAGRQCAEEQLGRITAMLA